MLARVQNMPPRRRARRANEDQPQGDISNAELRNMMAMMAQNVAAMAQAHQAPPAPAAQVAPNAQSIVIRDFLRMTPPTFSGTKVEEDPEEFLEAVKRVCDIMRLADVDKVDCCLYQLNDVARSWAEQWRKNRPNPELHPTWYEFEQAFLGRFFPQEKRNEKRREFLNLKQNNLSITEYGMKFTKLSKYAPDALAGNFDRMDSFVAGLSPFMIQYGRTAMLTPDMDMGRFDCASSTN